MGHCARNVLLFLYLLEFKENYFKKKRDVDSSTFLATKCLTGFSKKYK